jgi:hypothetical protein
MKILHAFVHTFRRNLVNTTVYRSERNLWAYVLEKNETHVMMHNRFEIKKAN